MKGQQSPEQKLKMIQTILLECLPLGEIQADDNTIKVLHPSLPEQMHVSSRAVMACIRNKGDRIGSLELLVSTWPSLLSV